MQLRWLRWLVMLFLVATPLAVIAGYWFATSVEAYDVARRVIESDRAIHSRIQEIDTYRLAFFDGYRYSTFGTSARAEYRFVVSADAVEGVVDLVLERRAGRWRLVEGTLRVPETQPVSLEPRELE